MTLKTLLTAAVLTLVPVMSFAECSGRHEADQQAMTCLPGTQWDQATGACLPVETS